MKCLGEHQKINASLAASVAEKLGVSKKNILKGLLNANQPLRLEEVSKKPKSNWFSLKKKE